MVKAVLPGSAAVKGGLRAGDVLLEYDGARLESPDDLKPAARRFAVAETLSHLERLVLEGGAVRHEDVGVVSYTAT